uniref:DNA 3'-5' helicase n=1 Tax=Amphimedon queenslandica TaxID=400682 RepID=A0A1X7TS69_AMPQE
MMRSSDPVANPGYVVYYYYIPGICAEFVGDSQCDKAAVKAVTEGLIQLVFISPDSLLHNLLFHNMLMSPPYKEKLVAVVVDEAHCIKTWGDMFRVAFAELGQLRSITPTNTNVFCLTATATKETLSTVCKTMSLVDPIIIGTSSCRASIAYSVKSLPPIDEFCSVISQESRASTTEVKDVITSLCNIKSSLRIVVATTAFGMGIDCPNIRQIIHYKPSASLLKNLVELDATDFPRMHACYMEVQASMKDYAANSRKTSSRTPIALAAFNNE